MVGPEGFEPPPSWSQTMRAAVALRPDSLSAYPPGIQGMVLPDGFSTSGVAVDLVEQPAPGVLLLLVASGGAGEFDGPGRPGETGQVSSPPRQFLNGWEKRFSHHTPLYPRNSFSYLATAFLISLQYPESKLQLYFRRRRFRASRVSIPAKDRDPASMFPSRVSTGQPLS